MIRRRITAKDALYDGVPALLVLVIALVEAFGTGLPHYPTWVNVVFAVAMSGTVLVRRHHPAFAVIVFVAGALAWFPAWGFDGSGVLSGWLAAMFVFYAIGANGSGRRDDVIAVVTLLAFQLPNAAAIVRGDASALDVPLTLGILGALWLLGRTIRERGRLADVLRRERDERAALATATERARIARELHDVITHNVTVMVVEASAERRRRDDDPEAVESLRSIERSGRQTLTELRRLLGILRAPGDGGELSPQPTLRELEPMLERLREQGQDVRMTIAGEPPAELPAGVDLTAYRVVQEALTNVVKHAGDAHAEVVLRYGPRTIEIAIEDDGRGTNGNGTPGHGLAGMRERVAMVGGSLHAGPRPQGGFEVVASLPLDGQAP